MPPLRWRSSARSSSRTRTRSSTGAGERPRSPQRRLRVFGFGAASKIALVATPPLIFDGLKIALAVSFVVRRPTARSARVLAFSLIALERAKVRQQGDDHEG